MSKYIDAEKLIAEIERQLTSINRRPLEMRGDYVEGLIDSFNRTITFITSLQQDETQVDKMLCSQIWWEEQGWIMIPPDVTIKGIDSLLKQIKKKLQQEQPEVDLEKEEFVGVAESPLKTFPRVNDFECGGSYRH